jgi:hypothetical protein
MDVDKTGHQMASNAFVIHNERAVYSKQTYITEAVRAVAVFGTLSTSM